MTIEQTVEIPASPPTDGTRNIERVDEQMPHGVGPLNAVVTVNATGRRLTIDVPREIPAGPVVLTFTPKPAESAKPEEGAKSAMSHADFLSGILTGAGDSTREQIRKDGTKSATSHADFLSGICASAGDITLEQIREERLVNRYLK